MSPLIPAGRQETLQYLLVRSMTHPRTCDFADTPIPIGPSLDPLVRESPIQCGMDLPSSPGRRDARADCPALPDHVRVRERGPCQATALRRRSISSAHQQPLPSICVPPAQARHISSPSLYCNSTAVMMAANFWRLSLRASPMHRLRVLPVCPHADKYHHLRCEQSASPTVGRSATRLIGSVKIHSPILL